MVPDERNRIILFRNGFGKFIVGRLISSNRYRRTKTALEKTNHYTILIRNSIVHIRSNGTITFWELTSGALRPKGKKIALKIIQKTCS